MITYNGEVVGLRTGSPSIETIGISLGRIVRFCGHTKYFYTVLCHSLTVAALMPEPYGIYGLMHDSQECLVSDVPTPMKSQVARNRECVLQKRIYFALGIPWPSEAVVEAVDIADEKALVAEAHILEHPAAEVYWGTDFDPEAGRLTRKHLMKAEEWLRPDIAAVTFTAAFFRYHDSLCAA